ncbi:IclR family transcriptional regulator [Sphingobium estronivorans]|uniref:IclR family transcriptional regulator n=1 Tax=Sphingobium estronivorans TaxID=1577690 RepID=UPI001966E6F0|nr:helix-turn-helix domain-containing protein [Sphingobium estronivorans]
MTSVVKILGLLLEESPRWLNASEIARRCDLSKASTHRFLLALLAGHFVMRNPEDLTYTLGSALIALGAASAGEGPVLQLVRNALNELANETGMNAEAFQVMPDAQVICIATCAGPGPVAINRSVGSRLPHLPLVNLLQIAWSGKAGSQGQGFRNGGRVPEEFTPELEEDIRWVRSHGYTWAISAGDNASANLDQIKGWLQEAGSQGIGRSSEQGREAQLDEILKFTEARKTTTATRVYQVPTLGIAAPIFDINGETQLQLCVISLLAQVQPNGLPHIGEIVKKKADKLTEVLGGRMPRAL